MASISLTQEGIKVEEGRAAELSPIFKFYYLAGTASHYLQRALICQLYSFSNELYCAHAFQPVFYYFNRPLS